MPPTNGSQVRAFRLLLLGLTLVGAALRLVHLDTTLGYDETVTARRFVEGGLPAIFADYGGYGSSNNHVLNSLLAWASTRIFGLHVWALRLPAFLLGVLTVPLLGLVAERLLRDRTSAAIAAFLAAFSPILIAYSPACRGYAPLLFFALLSVGLLLHVVEDGERRKAPLLALALFAVGWSHMTGLVFAATCGVMVVVLLLFSRRPGDPLAANRGPAYAALAAIALAGIVLVLWYSRGSLILQDVQSRIVTGKFVDPSLAGLRSVHGEGDVTSWVEHTGKKFFGTSGRFLLVCLPIAALGILLAVRRHPRHGSLLACAVLFPPAALLVGRLKPFPRYFLFVQPFVLVLVAVALTWLGRRLLAREKGGTLAAVGLAVAFQALAFPLLWESLSGPGARVMGIEWDVKGAVDHLAAEIGPDDVVLSFPLPDERGEWGEWAFPQTFEYHAETQLAPILSQHPVTDPPRVRRVWYVTPQREIRDLAPLPNGFEPELVRELHGCYVFRDELEVDGWIRADVPPLDAGWTLTAPFENVTLTIEGEGPEGLRAALLVEESGADGELVSPALPVTGGRLVELRTELAVEQSGGMRPFGRIGFHFYDDAGQRIATTLRPGLPWEGLRPRPGESFLRLTTCVPRNARSMELVLGLAYGTHAGDVVRFRSPVLLTAR